MDKSTMQGLRTIIIIILAFIVLYWFGIAFAPA